jgi:hypothetical protein
MRGSVFRQIREIGSNKSTVFVKSATTRRTLPLGNKVAVGDLVLAGMGAVGVHVRVSGSKSSALDRA